jgi:hypothetical protein
MHMEFVFIVAFLRIRVIRIFANFFHTTVCCLSVRPPHKLHSIAANYHMNSMQPILVSLPSSTEIYKTVCVSMELLCLTSLEALQ